MIVEQRKRNKGIVLFVLKPSSQNLEALSRVVYGPVLISTRDLKSRSTRLQDNLLCA